MTLTIPLQPGTVLANVRYYWILGGVKQSVQTTGITQPDASFPMFVFTVTPPDGADEIIAYDVTDATNWNAGQFKIQSLNAAIGSIAAPHPQPPPIPVPSLFAISPVPGTTFRSVYEAVIRRLGYNPKGDQVKEDVAQNAVIHINERIMMSWSVWVWPQLNVMEWRAFRPVWTDTSQVWNAGDEIYYFGDNVLSPGFNPPRNVDPPIAGLNAGYYHCGVTCPPGTLPTNLTYFTPLDLTDKYIAYQQTFENVIGELLDVYDKNPRETSCKTKIFNSYPSSKGVDVRGFPPDVPWIRYRVPIPQFTVRPFVDGATNVGDTFYDPVTGNCLIFTGDIKNQDGSVTHTGQIVLCPLFLSGYVKEAAYADCILETAQPEQVRLTLAQAALSKAEAYLMREIDKLAEQGQRLFYSAFPQRRYHYGRRIDVGVGAIPVETFSGFQ